MSKFKAVIKLIKDNKKFLVTSHHNPDADAVASVLAMAIYLKSLGKIVHVLNEDVVPQWLGFLPQTKLFKKASDVKLFNYDVALVLDCGDLARIGGVEKLLIKDHPVVNIDHHVTNDHFGDVNIIIPKASSTCEIIFEFFKDVQFSLNKNVAVLLYAGLMTDTGSFRYENTTGRVHEIAGELMAFGLNAQDLYEHLYVGMPVKAMKEFIEVIHRAELLLNQRVFCVELSKNVIELFSKEFDLKEKIFSFLRSVNGVEVVVILMEVSLTETRINLRSQGVFNVAKLAQKFEGGGHIKAAGAKTFDSLSATKKRIIASIANQFKGKE